jgi:hypothetical protein
MQCFFLSRLVPRGIYPATRPEKRTIQRIEKRQWQVNSPPPLSRSSLYLSNSSNKPIFKVEHYPEGYPQLAAFINSDDSFAIFRKFSRTNTRLLLHLQAEIQVLEKELDTLDRGDARDSEHFHRLISVKHEKGWDTRQEELREKLQEKMFLYCKD